MLYKANELIESRLIKGADRWSQRQEKEKPFREKAEFLDRRIGARYSAARTEWGTFQVYDDAQKSVIADLAEFREGIAERIRRCDGLVLFGGWGTGKDHLLAGLLWDAVAAGFSADWINGLEFFGGFADRIDTKQPDRPALTALRAPDVLGISDTIPPFRGPGAWDVEHLYRVLDLRYRDLKPTWMTLNATSAKEAQEKLGTAVWDRLQHEALIVPCFWQSFRERSGA